MLDKSDWKAGELVKAQISTNVHFGAVAITNFKGRLMIAQLSGCSKEPKCRI